MVQAGHEARVLMQVFGKHLNLRSLQLYAQSDVVAVDNSQLMGDLCALQGVRARAREVRGNRRSATNKHAIDRLRQQLIAVAYNTINSLTKCV